MLSNIWEVQTGMVGVLTNCWQREFAGGYTGTVWDDMPGVWHGRLNCDGYTVFYEGFDNAMSAMTACENYHRDKTHVPVCECGKDKHGFLAHSRWCPKQGT